MCYLPAATPVAALEINGIVASLHIFDNSFSTLVLPTPGIQKDYMSISK
jgi:hypothetical protein